MSFDNYLLIKLGIWSAVGVLYFGTKSVSYGALVKRYGRAFRGVECKVTKCDLGGQQWVGGAISLRPTHIVVVNLQGGRHSFALGRETTLRVSYNETESFYVIRARLLLSFEDDRLKVLAKSNGEGLGEFLEICRHAGVEVKVEAFTEPQIKFAQMAAEVASRLAVPPASTSLQNPLHKENVCISCGAKAAITEDVKTQACGYCGSSNFTALNG